MSLQDHVKVVPGENKGSVMLYALSTCGWCRKTKALLDELGVDYRYIDVDLLESDTKKQVMDEVARWNERRSFPTLVIGNSQCIVGYQEEKTREALGHGNK